MRQVFLVFCIFLAQTAMAQSGNGNYVVVDIGNVKPYWKVAQQGEPVRLPKSAMHKHAEGCVSVGFSIEADGKPANPVVLRSGFTDQADRQVIRDVEQRVLRNFGSALWVAADSNPDHKPVYTYGTYSFSLYEQPAIKADVDKRSDFVRATCDIPDFPAAVARGDLIKKAAP
jgi:hypothetical protein